MLVTGLDAFEVEHGEAAEFAHLDGKRHVYHAVHRTGENGDAQGLIGSASRRGISEGGVHLIRVDGHLTGDECNLVKTIGDSCFAVAADPHAHRKKEKRKKLRG